jgi:hypothetical protein
VSRNPTDALEELAGMVRDGAVDPERTRTFLEGEREVPTSMRLPASLLARMDALAPRLAEHPALRSRASERVSRSAVLRAALERGLGELLRDVETFERGPGAPEERPRKREVLEALSVVTRWIEHLPPAEEGDDVPTPEGGTHG